MQHPTEEEKELHEALLLNIAESEQETRPTDGIWFVNVVEKLDWELSKPTDDCDYKLAVMPEHDHQWRKIEIEKINV